MLRLRSLPKRFVVWSKPHKVFKKLRSFCRDSSIIDRCSTFTKATTVEGAVRRMRTILRYPTPRLVSGDEKAAPLGKSGGAGQLVSVAGLEVSLRSKVVVDRGMNGGELL